MYPTYQMINSDADLIIDGSCELNCDNAVTVNYLFKIFIENGSFWQYHSENPDYFIGLLFRSFGNLSKSNKKIIIRDT